VARISIIKNRRLNPLVKLSKCFEMGLCASGAGKERLDGDDAKGKDAEINAKLQEKARLEAKVFKLLMLGTGDSGKTTFVKQFTYMFGQGISSEDKVELFSKLVISNVLDSMKSIVKCCDSMSARDPNCVISSDNAKHKAVVLEYQLGELKYLEPAIATCVQALWSDPATQHAFNRYRKLLDIPEASVYFFENAKRYTDPSFVPSKDDILSVRARTTGVMQIEIKVEGAKLRFVDVGGQKNERKKWVTCFEDVTAVIFVVAISDFDQIMYEDQKTNRMQDSMDEFAATINNKYFLNTPIVLFFNKQDVLEDKLKTVKLADHFPDFKDDNTPTNVSEHFRQMFLKLNQNEKRDIFCYDTCAKSDDNIDKVFRAIKEVILKRTMVEATMLLPTT
jgi:GTPase SAR1 family protein